MSAQDAIRVSVLPADDDRATVKKARELARKLGIPLLRSTEDDTAYDLLLSVSSDRLELHAPTSPRAKPFAVDFSAAAFVRRLQSTSAHRQPLARALGIHSGVRSVVDATAGFGKDSFHIAAFGVVVTAVERSPIVAALLCDGLTRALSDRRANVAAAAARIKIVAGDSHKFLAGLRANERPDAIYLDPMYTPRRRQVKVKKEMHLLRTLVGNDEDANTLFEVAIITATRRVVVKRHPLAPSIAPNPTACHKTKMVRYDVYHMNSD